MREATKDLRTMGTQGNGAHDYDVIVVGGGPAGASAAIRLAQLGARVLVAEQKRFPRAKLCGEFISPECAAHFVELGVLAALHASGATRLTRTDFYTRNGRRVSVPSAWFAVAGNGAGTHEEDGARAAYALGLSRAEMDARLLARAEEAGAEVWQETQARGVVLEDGRVRGVELQRAGETRTVRAAITLDATGRTRALARRITRTQRADEHTRHDEHAPPARARLVAFKAHLDNTNLAAGACEIYFYRGGYGGLSRVEGGLANLCFIVAARDVRARARDAERVMREVLMTNRRAARALSGARVRSEWLAVALESFGRARLVPADGLLTVGDAAAFIDPFTGSGMLMALEGGALAAATIARALPTLRSNDGSFHALAADYRARYRACFGARLRACSMLRRAAFAPPPVTEAVALALGASAHVRRALARATRQAGASAKG